MARVRRLMSEFGTDSSWKSWVMVHPMLSQVGSPEGEQLFAIVDVVSLRVRTRTSWKKFPRRKTNDEHQNAPWTSGMIVNIQTMTQWRGQKDTF